MSFNEKTNKYEGFLYIITNSVNDKVYIGQTITNIKARWAEHKHEAGRENPSMVIAKAIKKYGVKNFKISELEKVMSSSIEELKQLLNEKEIDYIKQYDSTSHKHGYNVTPGGDNRPDFQKETTYCFEPSTGTLFKIFQSRADAGEYFNTRSGSISNAIKLKGLCKGYYFSSNNVFDYIPPAPSKMSTVPVKQYKDSVLINTYSSCTEAANVLGLNKFNIYGACMGTHKSIGGYVWRFEYDDYNKYPLPPIRTKAVHNYTRDDVYVSHYDSILDASIDVNTPTSNISAVLAKRENCKTAGGYKWFYADDPNQPDKSKIITSNGETDVKAS